MNIDERNFPYLEILIQNDENINVIYYLGDKIPKLAIKINQKYKWIEICQEAFTDLTSFQHDEGMNFNLSPKKIFEVTSLIPRLTIPRSDLNEWLMAFNELSKYNELKSVKANKEHLKEVVDNL